MQIYEYRIKELEERMNISSEMMKSLWFNDMSKSIQNAYDTPEGDRIVVADLTLADRTSDERLMQLYKDNKESMDQI